MARRRKQQKKVREPLDLRHFEHTAEAEALAVEAGAEDLPSFFVDTLAGAYGASVASQALAGLDAAAERPVTLRANTIRATRDEVASALDAAEIPHEPVSWYEDAFVVPRAYAKTVWDLGLVDAGQIYLQSLSSMLPPLALELAAGEDVLDMCAAPGGKTTQMHALAPAARITACEMHVPRAEKLEHNLRVQGAQNVQVMRCDARELDEFFSFDKILLDAPCTGSGTLSLKNPRTLKGFSEALLQKCARSQRALLDRALSVLKPGGVLVYSTCSILPQENEDAVIHALKKHPDCKIMPLDASVPNQHPDDANEDEGAGTNAIAENNDVTQAVLAGELPLIKNDLSGTLTVMPTRDYEGFYLAKIKKK